ncbi:MAG: ATP-grasp domain-containing protein [Candidatus Woesearchaeota archaeon]
MRVGVLSNRFTYSSGNKEVEADLSEVAESIQKSLSSLGYEIIFFDVDSTDFNDFKKKNIDVVFNVCERYKGDAHNEGLVIEMLENANVPFTGSPSSALKLCNDKAKIKELLIKHKISTPNSQIFKTGDEKINESFKFPLIVKPTLEHNSIGITDDAIVKSEEQLRRQVKKIIMEFKQPCLAEEFIKGKDIEINILGSGNDLKVLPLAEIEYEKYKGDKNEIFFSYENKWNEESDVYGDYIFPDNIPKDVESKMKEIAVYLYKLTGLRDYGRIDFRLTKDNVPYVIEVTANPGLSEVCSSPEAYEHMGLSYGDLMRDILNYALKRYNIK